MQAKKRVNYELDNLSDLVLALIGEQEHALKTARLYDKVGYSERRKQVKKPDCHCIEVKS